jgi:hypothetical protein
VNRPHLLHLRSRALPSTLVWLTGAAAAAGCYLQWAAGRPDGGQMTRAVVCVLAPVLVTAGVGTSLHSHSPDADRTASRPWWPLRTGHLLMLTALASVLLALAMPGSPTEFGDAAMVRNLLGAMGVTALAVSVIGARLSWLPMFAYGGAAVLLGPPEPGGTRAVWHWLMQPGPQTAAWGTAVAAFVAGTALYALRGPRRTG